MSSHRSGAATCCSSSAMSRRSRSTSRTASIDVRVVSSSSRTVEKSAATSIEGSRAPGPNRCRDDGMSEPSREDYERGLPDHHDPTAGFGGAAPAQSALTLRLALAVFGLVVCVGGGLVWLPTDFPAWPAVLLFVLALVTVVDLVVI